MTHQEISYQALAVLYTLLSPVQDRPRAVLGFSGLGFAAGSSL
jgi:hypothetical protein